MNVITYKEAYCLYPRATLCKSGSLVLKPGDEAVRKATSKYTERGFRTRRLVGNTNRWYNEGEVRFVRDAHTWRFNLSDFGFEKKVVERIDPVSVTTWSIATFAGDYHRVHFRLSIDEPSVFPIIAATGYLKNRVATICLRLESLTIFNQNEPTPNGEDK